MLLTRDPQAALRPFVKVLWATDQTRSPHSATAHREHVLPTGDMHLVFRLSDQPIHSFEGIDDDSGHTLGHAVVGGARAGFYVKDISGPVCSIGVQLRAGAAQALFGVPADELAKRHTRLDDLWGAAAGVARERLLESRSPALQLAMLESLLATRLPRIRSLHPAVAQALTQFQNTFNVRDVVTKSGYSHRQFVALFSQAVGLAPKLYCRVYRFQRVLEQIAANQITSWADLAVAAGYGDQSHFNREFREFTGITPEAYRSVAPASAHHVPLRPGP